MSLASAPRRPWLAPMVLVALTALVYWPGLSGGFLFDDFPNIVTNPRVHAESLDLETLRRAAGGYFPGLYGRPLATLGFAFDWYVGGKDAWAFKVHSLLVHLVTALLVFALVRKLLSLPRAGGPWPAWAPAALALVWSIHPLQVSTVLYVVQRMEMLAVLFVVSALLAYLRGRAEQERGAGGWGWIAFAVVLAGIGMLAKETAALFPAFALALEVTLLGFRAADPRTVTLLRRGYLAGCIVAAALFVFWLLPEFIGGDHFRIRGFTLAERMWTQLRVLPMYLGQMLLPASRSLPFYYDAYPVSTGWLSPATTLAGGVFLAGLAALAVFLRHRVPLAALGILWFFAAHLITSNVMPLELAFEHRNYFALLGVLLAVAALVAKLPLDAERPIAPFAVAVVVIGFATLTLLRSATWGHPLVLAADLVAKSPMSPRASSDLATLYVSTSGADPNHPLFSLGMKEFERGSRLPGASPLPEQGLILSAATTGRPARDEWWDRIDAKLREQPIGPNQMAALSGLLSQRRAGIGIDDRRLVQAFGILLARDGVDLRMYLEFADFALAELHDEPLAERTFLAALDHPGMTPSIAARIVAVLAAEGHPSLRSSIATRAAERGLLGPAAGR